MSASKNPFAVLAEFKNPADLMDAASAVNKAGYKHFDTYSPFPIHGMDDAMGLKSSKLGWIVLIHGIIGLAGGIALQVWSMNIAYPVHISGKPYLNFPAFVPVAFALVILLSSFGAFMGMFFLNKLPRLHNPLFNSNHIERASDDGFFLCIEARDPIFAEKKTTEFLEKLGATNTEIIPDS
ncbi:DUF3341 domain-containing protein [Natronogracilivirga saccharolytica]|uniref:DUF3341 domain-containing protein n=1 Tax=Natronogracilivirga saccharolytica TaxID=2812953 RepID=A0A8J7RNS7_9BACT|nr:DUF3341 domain-containing protein [Natronogracilivirga saccharolytica]MBP3191069.1 DUF3341 domain-containing protein [Natronogracilivirga saccharolytica]